MILPPIIVPLTYDMRKSTLLAILILFALGATVRAQVEPKDFRMDVHPRSAPFAAGTKTLEFEGAYVTPIRFSTDEFTNGSVGIGYYPFNGTSFTLFAHGFHANQEFDRDVDGGGLSVRGRTHLLNIDKFSIYFDGGGGLLWGNTAFPVGGTTYNIVARGGFGAAYPVAENAYLTAGARYFHVSNGQVHGRSHNPSFDGIEWYVGMMFTFR